ncbi:hypothetical protein ACFX2I_022708 [Malus domestica]
MCLALVFAIQKLRHYMHAYTIHLVAKADSIIYVPAKAVKGQALADFLADHPIPADWKISDDLPDEEMFYIDIFPTWMIELCSNNVTEYQALIIGLQMAINMGITALEIFGDSKLIINQLLTEYEVRKDDLIPYFRLATQLLQEFETMTLKHVPRKENQMADALANLASSMTLGEDEAAEVLVCQRWVIPLVTEMLLDDTNVISVLPVDVEEWRQPLIDYLEHGKLPDDPRHRSEIREEEVNQAMEEAHSGVCRAHQSGPKLHFQLKRMGYYWPSMVKDCLEYAKRCQACQFHETSYTNHLSHYTLQLLHGHSMHGDWTSYDQLL